MTRGQFPRNEESEAHPALRFGVPGDCAVMDPVEAPENHLSLIGSDPDTLVAHTHERLTRDPLIGFLLRNVGHVAEADVDPDAAACRGVPNRVGQ